MKIRNISESFFTVIWREVHHTGHAVNIQLKGNPVSGASLFLYLSQRPVEAALVITRLSLRQ